MTKLSDVNTTDIRDAVSLGCRAMSSVFNADDNDIPFFLAFVRPFVRFRFNPFSTEAHIPGRHLNALLTAEHVLGVKIDEAAVEKHTRAAYLSYSGPVALPLNRDRIGGKLINFNPENTREGFHALYALVAYRGSARAHDLAERAIQAIVRLWNPERGWDRDQLEGTFGLSLIKTSFPEVPFINGLARAIGPLVKYYRATNSEAALQLATVLKDKAIAENYLETGEYDPKLLGVHVHDITCVLSSLAQLAAATQDAPLMNRVKAFYDNGLRQFTNQIGWAAEFAGPTADPRFPDRTGDDDGGEGNSTGDILETALILGRWGYTECYDFAERILRAFLLPSQLRDTSFATDPPNPEGTDDKHAVLERLRGAWGYAAPYGHQPVGFERVLFTLDVVGGVVGSLCEAFRAISEVTPQGHVVNLLFDHSTDALDVESPYTHGALTLRTKRPGPILLRVPSWSDVRQIEVMGATSLPRLINGYLHISEPRAQSVTIKLPLTKRDLVLTYRKRRIATRMEGDRILQMENFGADLTFFDAL
jgi:hypothetical protein